MKKMNNKGFSLVELIVVVAIMAVLIGVLAPQYLRYVEKSRLQKDNAAIGEVANAVKIACADEKINNQVASVSGGNVSYVLSTATEQNFSTGGTALLNAEMQAAIGKVKLGSNTYVSNDVTLNISVAGGNVTVQTNDWIEAPGEAAVSHNF